MYEEHTYSFDSGPRPFSDRVYPGTFGPTGERDVKEGRSETPRDVGRDSVVETVLGPEGPKSLAGAPGEGLGGEVGRRRRTEGTGNIYT